MGAIVTTSPRKTLVARLATAWPVLVTAALSLWFAWGGVPALAAPPVDAGDHAIPYQYEKTRRLVAMVNDAAALVAKEGEKAFAQFSKPDSRWFNGGIYLFVFDAKGVCLFHPVAPGLVGQNLLDLHDFDGKPVISRMVALTRNPSPDAAGWFFYLWEDGTQFFPIWKSAYVRKVVAPSGQSWVIGAGLYNLRVEREFVRERVDAAARLVAQKGRAAAFREFLDLASPFVFLNTYIFVLDMQGRTLVDPAFPTHVGRSLIGFKDAVGKPVVEEILAKMRVTNAAWVQYKWPMPATHVLGRKVAYIRKVQTPEGPVIVGADCFLASPVWMKD